MLYFFDGMPGTGRGNAKTLPRPLFCMTKDLKTSVYAHAFYPCN
jgi:hypothetical protein